MGSIATNKIELLHHVKNLLAEDSELNTNNYLINSLNKEYKKGIKTIKLDIDNITIASTDASFRSYYRLNSLIIANDNKQYLISLIVMFAPPDKEDCKSFIDINTLLRPPVIDSTLSPRIYYVNLRLGIIILEDLGTETLYDKICNIYSIAIIKSKLKLNTEIKQLYVKILEKSLEFSFISHNLLLNRTNNILNTIASYDRNALMSEMNLFEQWYLFNYSNKSYNNKFLKYFNQLKQNIVDYIIALEKVTKRVLVHKDYHSRNIMIKNSEIKIIDYQDALIGNPCYDIASLIKDSYVVLSSNDRFYLTKIYWQLLRDKKLIANKISFEQFCDFVDLVGAQRQIKILGIFTRLAVRDGKKNYLNEIPSTAQYILNLKPKYKFSDIEVDFLQLQKYLSAE